jgi:hypothetical protein
MYPMITIPNDGNRHGLAEGVEAVVGGGSLILHRSDGRVICLTNDLDPMKRVIFKDGYVGQPGERCWNIEKVFSGDCRLLFGADFLRKLEKCSSDIHQSLRLCVGPPLDTHA